jgi:hypothetical protein
MLGNEFKYVESYRMVIFEDVAWNGGRKTQNNKRNRYSSNAFGDLGNSSNNNNMKKHNKRSFYKFCLWCMNPAVAFEEIAKQTHSIILASGTLSPLDSFATELGVEFKIRLEAKHVINTKRQLWVGAIGHGGKSRSSLKANYANTKTEEYKNALGNIFLRSIDKIPGGILVFFPSYSLMSKVIERWEDNGIKERMEMFKTCFQEPRGGGKEQLEKVLLKYRHKASTTGAILFAVFRGKISEGVDFSDHNARAVFIIGIPYPAFKDLKVVLKREYQDKRKQSNESTITGSQWYSQQAFRALNQALGRCIRHRHDYGAIFLLDSRYCNAPNIVNQLSKWVRPSVETYQSVTRATHNVNKFFTSLKQSPPGGQESILKQQKVKNTSRKTTIMMETNANNNNNNISTENVTKLSASIDVNRGSAGTGVWISRVEAARNIDLHTRGSNGKKKRKGTLRTHNRRRNKRKDKQKSHNVEFEIVDYLSNEDTTMPLMEFMDEEEDQRVANMLRNRKKTPNI